MVDDRSARIREEFDAKAPHYECNRLAPWYQAHGELLLAHLAPAAGDLVLDVGCGTGHFLRRLRAACPGVEGVGLDLAPAMVEGARVLARDEGLDRLAFVAADWEAPDPDLDAILGGRRASHLVCASVLHYFADPGLALRRMHAALRPGAPWTGHPLPGYGTSLTVS